MVDARYVNCPTKKEQEKQVPAPPKPPFSRGAPIMFGDRRLRLIRERDLDRVHPFIATLQFERYQVSFANIGWRVSDMKKILVPA